MAKVGDKIRIIRMEGETGYDGREGVITRIDEPYPPGNILEQWHGTWGGLAVQPWRDKWEAVK